MKLKDLQSVDNNSTMVATNVEEWGELGELPPVEAIQQAINTRYDAMFHYDHNEKRHAYVCTICNEFILCHEDLVWLQFETLKECRELLVWERLAANAKPVPQGLRDAYVFNDIDGHFRDADWIQGMALSPRGVTGKKSQHGNSKLGVSCCATCKNCLSNGVTPFNAIVNSHYVGHAPPCLRELTPVELALISPIKGYGYCFSYAGGTQKKLKGSMTFMRVKEDKIARAVGQLEAMEVSEYVIVLLNGNLTPSQKQRAQSQIRVDKLVTAVEWLIKNNEKWAKTDLEKYRKEFETKCPVFVDNSKEVQSENENLETKELFSCYFPDGSLDENLGGCDTREEFKAKVNEIMKDGNCNIDVRLNLEKTFANDNQDIFLSCCLLQFPYGVGGINDKRLKSDGSNSLTDKTDLEQYIRHLNRLSETEFHEPMFQLISYSMLCKLKLIRRSRLQLRGKQTAAALANGITSEDVNGSVRGRAVGNRFAGTRASRTLLKAVDACSQALPHTNESSRAARSTGEAMQHHFALQSVFFTVTFDDENSLLMQILEGTEIDNDTNLQSLTDDQLAARSTKRKELRLKFPGLAAKNFEMLLNICIEEVIGWSMRKNRPTEKPGLFGNCDALALAFEEQGRLTVHCHGSAWFKKLRALQKRMFFGSKNQKRIVNAVLSEFHERVVSTSMMTAESRRTYQFAFDHDNCTVPRRDRSNPTVVDKQSLRNLRHKKGYKECDGLFAICPHCRKGWTNEELLHDYLHSQAEFVTCLPCTNGNDSDATAVQVNKNILPKARMFARILQFQRKRDVHVVNDTPVLCINASYQHHVSCHVKGCFKCSKLGKAHKCGPNCECRFRLPDLSRDNAKVRTLHNSTTWYEWNGTGIEQPLVEFLPKRGTYDMFQNASCRAISESKLSCNSNVSLITDGPVGQYQFKYQMKGTQEDDSRPYREVENSIKSLNGRAHEDDRKEAIRVVCRAAFAHNKKNVIGPSMASYLNEHGSRFYFSHDFVYCPLKDIIALLNNAAVDGIARYSEDGTMFFENQALHYLCRSQELEDCSVKEFFEEYRVLNTGFYEKKHKRDDDGDDDVFPFEADTGYFKHPSAKTSLAGSTPIAPSVPPTTPTSARKPRRNSTSTPKKKRSTPNSTGKSGLAKGSSSKNRRTSPNSTGKRQKTGTATPSRRCRGSSTPKSTPKKNRDYSKTKQGVKTRDYPLLIKISQWMFPDTGKFKGHILTCPEDQITSDMEIYAQLVLALFLPHRCLSDLQSTGTHPFTKKLRQVNSLDTLNVRNGIPPVVFSDENLQFLQNIQDCAYNSMRYKVGKDILQSETEPFTNYDGAEEATEDNEDDSDDIPEDSAYRAFMEFMDTQADATDKNPDFLQGSLQHMGFMNMRMNGKNQSGFNTLFPTPTLEQNSGTEGNDFVTYLATTSAQSETTQSQNQGKCRNPGIKRVVELLFTKTQSRARKEVFKFNPDFKAPDPNGTVGSILEWGSGAGLDIFQKRAFQSILASFLLTFFDTEANDEEDDETVATSVRTKHRRAKKNLLQLKGGSQRKDPQLIMLLHGPGGAGKSTVINLVVAYAKEYCSLLGHPFTQRTIIITAMSGVAATLLHGETTHSALGLNRKTLDTDQVEAWSDTRLIFVDECSFAGDSDYEAMYKNAQVLGSELYRPYGGKNMVFAGDFSQLEPPGRLPVYTGDRCFHFHDTLNAYIELDGMHRFDEDLPWGHRLFRFRSGLPRLEDIKTINKECLITPENQPPIGAQVACFTNKDRDAVNCMTFERFCQENKPVDGSIFFGAIMILMDNLEMAEAPKQYVGVTSNAVKRHFWTTCGEDSCRHGQNGSSRVDPVLKLYPKCPLMLTQNKDVPNGQANGSRTFLEGVMVKPECDPMIIELECGATIRAFFASQIHALKLKHEAKDIKPTVFEVKSESFSFNATMTIDDERKICAMKGQQFSVVSNTATTGHKLQGYTALCLIVNDWHYGQNWAYVVLSRVTTMKGLFLTKPLSEDLTKYAMSDDMKEMLREFQRTILLTRLDDSTYEDILKFEQAYN